MKNNTKGNAPKSGPEKIKDYLSSFDVYGAKVSLNINGKGTHKTIPGCVWSLIFYMSLTFFAVYYLLRWSSNLEFVTMTSTVYQEKYTPICFECLEYTFSFNIKDSVNNVFIKPAEVLPYFDFELRHESWKYDSQGHIQPVFKTLELAKCFYVHRNVTNIKGNVVEGASVEMAFDDDYAWCFK